MASGCGCGEAETAIKVGSQPAGWPPRRPPFVFRVNSPQESRAHRVAGVRPIARRRHRAARGDAAGDLRRSIIFHGSPGAQEGIRPGVAEPVAGLAGGQERGEDSFGGGARDQRRDNPSAKRQRKVSSVMGSPQGPDSVCSKSGFITRPRPSQNLLAAEAATSRDGAVMRPTRLTTYRSGPTGLGAPAHARPTRATRAATEVRDGRKPGTRVFTVRDGTCGVPTLVLEAPGTPNS